MMMPERIKIISGYISGGGLIGNDFAQEMLDEITRLTKENARLEHQMEIDDMALEANAPDELREEAVEARTGTEAACRKTQGARMSQRDFIGEINHLKERVKAWKWEAGRYKNKWRTIDAMFQRLLCEYGRIWKLLWFTLAAFVLQIFEVLLFIWWIKS